MGRGVASCALMLLAGCGRLGFDPGDAAGGAPLEAGVDARGGDAMDAVGAATCSLAPEGDVVALYGFEGGLGDDVMGQHPGAVRGTVSASAGRCGTSSARFAGGYVLVPPSPGFDLAIGSIELFVRVASPVTSTNQVMVARDSDQTVTEGHLLVLLNDLGQVVTRLQRGGNSYHRCGPAIAASTWTHLGVSFGGTAPQGFRMWIDGIEATLATSSLANTGAIDCTGVPPAGGIQGNPNALVLGANNGRAPDGAADPMVDQFLAGDLDQVRIRSTWRDFSAP